jgi:hypothetical protein
MSESSRGSPKNGFGETCQSVDLPLMHHPHGELAGIVDLLSSPPALIPPPVDIPPAPVPLVGSRLLWTAWPAPLTRGPAKATLLRRDNEILVA